MGPSASQGPAAFSTKMAGSQNEIKFTWLAACLVSLYGLGSWIVVNGLWVELPLLVNVLPEGWNLPAYLIVIIQIANVGPVLYVPLTKLFQSKTNGFCSRCLQPPERIANYLILTIALISCLLLAQFWKTVIYIPSLKTGYHSIGLFILALLASTVDCTSSVTFITYLNGMPQLYVGALHFGEAFSDLVPSVLALIQGVGPEPECINTTDIWPIHKIVQKSESDIVMASSFVEGFSQLHSDVNIADHSGPSTVLSCFLIGYISALNYGFLPAIQSYSCAAYNALTYHLAVTLSGAFSAISTVSTTFFVNRYSKQIKSTVYGEIRSISNDSHNMNSRISKQNDANSGHEVIVIANKSFMNSVHRKWIGIVIVSSLPAAYLICLASSSPKPPLLGGFGSASSILAWIAVRCLFTSLRTWIWMSLSSHSNKPMKLRLAGLSTQFGAALGAILSFLLVFIMD
ncbi:unnamed protein product [Heterobilharzia americana]|nr:unnamed protein product [Heterobilharzia americana]